MNTALRNDDRNFWVEIKKIRASKPTKCRMVEGVSDDNDIAQLFASSYKDTRMWANAQRDGRPAEYRWRPLFNAAKFG